MHRLCLVVSFFYNVGFLKSGVFLVKWYVLNADLSSQYFNLGEFNSCSSPLENKFSCLMPP